MHRHDRAEGQTFFGDYTDAHEITKLTDADIVAYGHPHTPDGAYRTDPDALEFTRPTFVAPGSVSRRDSSSYNRKRTPQVALITLPLTIGGPPKVDLRPLTLARPGIEVFSDLIKDEEDENNRNERMSAFVDTLQGTKISDDSWGKPQLFDF